jgi:NodT family efflux transporter outer membrane factor (OMF) lipoprotein
VSVAAEVASSYFGLKSCERLAAVAQQQAASVTESARLTQLLVQNGLGSSSQGASLQAARAQAQSAVAQMQTQCRSARTGLMALTGENEGPLMRQTAFDASKPLTPTVALPPVPTLPAQLLAQRPDVAAAQSEVTAASHDVGVANAQRYPRLGLAGSVTGTRAKTGAGTDNYLTWSIGPLAISLPLLDGGQREAASQAAVARYENAASTYRASVRKAVMEVEDALNNLQGSAEQATLALTQAEQLAVVQRAMQNKYQQGMASKIELEDVRRQALSAQTTVYSLELERIKAWVTLYRALGGGWQATETPVSTTARAGN